MYVCLCYAVTETQVRECVAAGASSLGDLQVQLGVASCCGCCAETASSYLPGACSPDAAALCGGKALEPMAARPAPLPTPQPAPAPVVRPIAKAVETVSTRRYPVHHIARAA